MRTQQEILKRINTIQNNEDLLFDAYGVDAYKTDLLGYLEYKYAKPFIRKDITEEYWKRNCSPDPLVEIKIHMPFAWEEANNCRKLSVSLVDMVAWVWLIDNDFYNKLKKSVEDNYECYGKPQLVLICEQYDIEWKKLDNDKWVNSEDDIPLTAKEVLEEGKIPVPRFEDEKYWVAEWQIRNGGSFASLLGAALAHADLINAPKIKETWPDLWREALEHTAERRKNKDYY